MCTLNKAYQEYRFHDQYSYLEYRVRCCIQVPPSTGDSDSLLAHSLHACDSQTAGSQVHVHTRWWIPPSHRTVCGCL